ncbi:hypothetical protein [Corynebacterium lizhenjunii]|uniref:hypothetical protein n=1 Tax=Corynebacterium lizhenjunii TaxID=2709394 RepID=UPI0013ED5573|nr:hypothetical protein [Corynebacterium lizhenjunii]
MQKFRTLAILGAASLALAACSPGNESPSTVTVTATPTETTTSAAASSSAAPTSSASETAGSTTAATSGSAAHLINASGLRSNLTQAGYDCIDVDECVRSVGDAFLVIDFDEDSIESKIKNAGDNLEELADTLISDIGVALGSRDYGGTTWTEIKDWSLDHLEGGKTTLGRVELDHENSWAKHQRADYHHDHEMKPDDHPHDAYSSDYEAEFKFLPL